MKEQLKVGDKVTLKEQVWIKNFKSKILKSQTQNLIKI
jgi:hypothetical protein